MLPRVNGNQGAGKVGQCGVDVVSVHGDDIIGRVASHVLVEHGEDVHTGAGIVLHDISAAEETALLTAVEVEFEGIAWCVASTGEDTKSLEQHDDALRWCMSVIFDTEKGFVVSYASIVVSSRGTAGRRTTHTIIVRRHDDDAAASTGNLGNDAGLVVAVRVAGHLDGRVGRGDGDDRVVHPGGALGGVRAAVVAVVDVGETVGPARQVGLGGASDERVGLGLVGGSRGDGLDAEGVVGQVVETESLKLLRIHISRQSLGVLELGVRHVQGSQ